MIITLLLIACLSIAPFFGVGFAKGTYLYNINWGHLKRDSPNPDEATAESLRCIVIRNMFNNQPGWDSWTGYGYDTTKENLYNTIVWRQNNDVWATDFWVGDFYPNNVVGYERYWGTYIDHWEWSEEYLWWIPVYVEGWIYEKDSSIVTRHYSYYCESPTIQDTSHDVNDFDLILRTNWPYSKQHFTFSWTCACADIIIDPHTSQPDYCYYDDYNYTGAVGMPWAWTSRADMSLTAYFDNPHQDIDYCFIGFDGASHPIIDGIDGTGHYYWEFITCFYSHFINGQQHHTIKQSLDYASNQIWGCTWDQTPLHAGYMINVPGFQDPLGPVHMQVFGNANLNAPYG